MGQFILEWVPERDKESKTGIGRSHRNESVGGTMSRGGKVRAVWNKPQK